VYVIGHVLRRATVGILFSKPEPRAPNSKAEPVGNEPPPINGTGKEGTRPIDRMWHTLLAPDELEYILVARDEIDDVVSLMVESRIDTAKFAGNYEVLLSGGHRAVEEMYPAASGGRTPLPSTLSISKFARFIDRPLGLPLWFLAGFPDVAVWAGDEQGASFNSSVDEKERIEITAMLLGVDLDAFQNSDDMNFNNNDGTLRSRYLRNLITNYTRKTGKSLEVAVQEGLEDDLYLGSDLLQMAGEENNWTLIATMTTKYYLESKRSYGPSFPDETALLSIAGILEATGYIFVTRQLTVAQVIAVAKETEGMQDRMQEFLIRFETLLLSKDNPEFSFEEVHEVCWGEAEEIRRSTQRTMDSYKTEPMIVADVRAVMLSPEFSELRREAGVSIVRS
jgi:hypothetical protein